MIRHDFLLEIRTEEIPANALANARLDFARLVKQALDEEGLEAEEVCSFATPRRLVLYLKGLPERQED
ncbi:MAG TPA: glycine--tRNA ligase subunit beta, partial [Thermoanaerobaculia bacterium]|nr:glycine--tRNA ligase subunit beta [Thermoanaerobaculia bacterium]